MADDETPMPGESAELTDSETPTPGEIAEFGDPKTNAVVEITKDEIITTDGDAVFDDEVPDEGLE